MKKKPTKKNNATKTKSPTKAKAEAPKRVSALDAAAEVLCRADKPMRSTEIIAAMTEQGLWSSPKGRTPQATLSAAMHREISDKGGDSRFAKSDRGLFSFNQSAQVRSGCERERS